MSLALRKEDPIDYATGLVDILVGATGESHASLARLQERENDCLDIHDYEEFVVKYFGLALEAQEIVDKLSYLEERTPKASSLSRITPDMRVCLGEMAKRHGVSINEDVLAAVPYIPLTGSQ